MRYKIRLMLQRFILSVLVLFLCCAVSSQTRSLVIFSANGHVFDLIVNNNQITTVPQSNVKVFQLLPGWQRIKISQFVRTQKYVYIDSILLSDDPKYNHKEFTYVVSEHNGKITLSFKSVSDRSGPFIPEIPEAPKKTNLTVDDICYGNLYCVNKHKLLFLNHYNPKTSICSMTLDDKDVDIAVKLFKTVDEETMLRYCQQIIQVNCYNTTQLELLLEGFTMELDRLKMTKQAYDHLIDKDNASLLAAMFGYPTVKETYLNFLREEEQKTKQKQLQCQQPVSDNVFNEIMINIKKGHYEHDKLNIAKQLLLKHCVSSIQTKKMAALFVHDREKLELFKSAYYVLTDKENAADVADELLFPETKKEFLQFIHH